MLFICRKSFLSVILFCLIIGASAQDVELDWAHTFHGQGGPSSGLSVVVDSEGNSFSVGQFSGTIDFDPGPDSSFITSNLYSSYILKLDPTGSFLWVKRIDGQTVNNLILDDSGNLVLVGNYGGYNDFDPGEDTLSFTNVSWDAFVLKLTSNGDLIWAKTFGGDGADIALSVGADASGNIYTTGTFIGSADFDPGAAEFELSAYNWDPFYPKTDMFISKLDVNGDFVWAGAIGGPYDDQGSSIAVDEAGNSYVTGFYYDTVDFDPSPGVQEQTASITNNLPRKEAFVMRLDPLGNLDWVHSIGDIASDEGRSVALDPLGDLFVFGSFFGTVDLDFGPGIHEATSTGNTDGFILKLEANGELIWALHNIPEEQSVDMDPLGNVYVSGSLIGMVDFDPGPDSLILSSTGSYPDLFIQKINPLGGFEWVVAFQNIQNAWQSGKSMAVDELGNILLTGGFLHSIDFDPGPDSLVFSTDLPASFILKLAPDSFIGIESETERNASVVYPNPSNGPIAIEFENPISGIIETRSSGGQLLERKSISNSKFFRSEINGKPGSYILTVYPNNGTAQSVKIIKK